MQAPQLTELGNPMWMKTKWPHVSATRGTRPLSAARKLRMPLERGIARRRPARSAMHMQKGQQTASCEGGNISGRSYHVACHRALRPACCDKLKAVKVRSPLIAEAEEAPKLKQEAAKLVAAT